MLFLIDYNLSTLQNLFYFVIFDQKTMKRTSSFTKLVRRYDQLQKKHDQIKTRFSINQTFYTFYKTYLQKDLQQDKRIFGYTNQDTIQYFRNNSIKNIQNNKNTIQQSLNSSNNFKDKSSIKIRNNSNLAHRKLIKSVNLTDNFSQQQRKNSSLGLNQRKQKFKQKFKNKKQAVKPFAKFINLQNSTAFVSPTITEQSLSRKSSCKISNSQYNEITVNPCNQDNIGSSTKCKFFYNKGVRQKQQVQKIKIYSKTFKDNFFQNIQHFSRIKSIDQSKFKISQIVYCKKINLCSKPTPLSQSKLKNKDNRQASQLDVKLAMRQDFALLRNYAYTIKLVNKSFEHNMKMEIMKKTNRRLLNYFLKDYQGKFTILLFGTETLASICLENVSVLEGSQLMFYSQQEKFFDIRQLLKKLQQSMKQLFHILILANPDPGSSTTPYILYEEFYQAYDISHAQIGIKITKYYIKRICCFDPSLKSSADLQYLLASIKDVNSQSDCNILPRQLIELLKNIPDKNIFVKNGQHFIEEFCLHKLLDFGIERLKVNVVAQNRLQLKQNIDQNMYNYRYFYICFFFEIKFFIIKQNSQLSN